MVHRKDEDSQQENAQIGKKVRRILVKNDCRGSQQYLKKQFNYYEIRLRVERSFKFQPVIFLEVLLLKNVVNVVVVIKFVVNEEVEVFGSVKKGSLSGVVDSFEVQPDSYHHQQQKRQHYQYSQRIGNCQLAQSNRGLDCGLIQIQQNKGSFSGLPVHAQSEINTTATTLSSLFFPVVPDVDNTLVIVANHEHADCYEKTEEEEKNEEKQGEAWPNEALEGGAAVLRSVIVADESSKVVEIEGIGYFQGSLGHFFLPESIVGYQPNDLGDIDHFFKFW